MSLLMNLRWFMIIPSFQKLFYLLWMPLDDIGLGEQNQHNCLVVHMKKLWLLHEEGRLLITQSVCVHIESECSGNLNDWLVHWFHLTFFHITMKQKNNVTPYAAWANYEEGTEPGCRRPGHSHHLLNRTTLKKQQKSAFMLLHYEYTLLKRSEIQTCQP